MRIPAPAAESKNRVHWKRLMKDITDDLEELEREIAEMDTLLAVPIPHYLRGAEREMVIMHRRSLRKMRRAYLQSMDSILGGGNRESYEI